MDWGCLFQPKSHFRDRLYSFHPFLMDHKRSYWFLCRDTLVNKLSYLSNSQGTLESISLHENDWTFSDRGCWWHNGSDVSLITVTRFRFRSRAVIWLKVTFVICEISVDQFDSTKHRKFSPGTPVSSCSNTGPMRCDPYWTSRENSSDNW